MNIIEQEKAYFEMKKFFINEWIKILENVLFGHDFLNMKNNRFEDENIQNIVEYIYHVLLEYPRNIGDGILYVDLNVDAGNWYVDSADERKTEKENKNDDVFCQLIFGNLKAIIKLKENETKYSYCYLGKHFLVSKKDSILDIIEPFEVRYKKNQETELYTKENFWAMYAEYWLRNNYMVREDGKRLWEN